MTTDDLANLRTITPNEVSGHYFADPYAVQPVGLMGPKGATRWMAAREELGAGLRPAAWRGSSLQEWRREDDDDSG